MPDRKPPPKPKVLEEQEEQQRDLPFDKKGKSYTSGEKFYGQAPSPVETQPWQPPVQPSSYFQQNMVVPVQSFIDQTFQQSTGWTGVGDQADFMDVWREAAYPLQNPTTGFTGQKIKGPGGEELPKEALGWDWNGEPYYGDGIQGWLNGVKSKWNESFTDTGEPIIAWKPQTTRFSNIAEAAGGNTWKVLDIAKTWDNIKSGEGSTPVGKVARVANATISAALDFFNEVSKKTEQVLFVGTQQPSSVWSRTIGQQMGYFDPNLLTIARGLSPKVDRVLDEVGWDPIMLTADEAEKQYQAGRIAYSYVAQPALYNEYMRRLDAGENPYLLALELENPLAEMVGQLIVDPLNLIGAPARKARDSARIGKALDEFVKVGDEVMDVLKLANLDEMQSAEKIAQFVAAHQREVTKSANRLDNLSKTYNLFTLTPGGKRSVLMRRAGEYLTWAAQRVDDPLELYKYTIKSVSDDPGEVLEALSYARSALDAPSAMFSEAGRDAGLMFKYMFGEKEIQWGDKTRKVVDIQGFINQFSAAQEEGRLLKWMDEKMETVARNLFPSIEDRNKAVQLLTKGEDVPDYLRLAAKQYDQGYRVSPLIKSLTKSDKLMQSAFYRPINTMLAGVYMGLSPGYAIRNAINNELTMLVDEGLDAVRLSTTNSKTVQLERLLGAPIPKLGEQAIGAKGTLTGFEQAGKGFWRGAVEKAPMIKLAGEIEKNNGLGIMLTASKKVMRSMISETMLPDVRPLLAAGVDSSVARSWAQRLSNNYYDVDKVARDLLSEMATGRVDAFKDLAWMREFPGMRAQLEAFSFEPSLQRIAESGSVDEAIDVVRTMRQYARDQAAKALDEIPSTMIDDLVEDADKMPLYGENITETTNAINNSELSAREGTHLLHYSEANRQANRSINNAIDQLYEELLNKTKGGARAIHRDVMRFVRGSDAEDAVTLNDKARAFTIMARDRSFTEDVDTLVRWLEDSANFEFINKPISSNDFRRAIWEEYYFPTVRSTWEGYRDRHYEDGLRLVEQLQQVATDSGVQLSKNGLISAQRSQERARKFDGVLREDEVRMALVASLKRDDNAQAARVYAHQFRISTATAKGTPRSSKDVLLLDIINDNLPEGQPMFNSLGEVPPDTAKRALAEYNLFKRPKSQAQGDLAKAMEKAREELEANTIGNNPFLDWLESIKDKDSLYKYTDTEWFHTINNASAMPVKDFPDWLRGMVLERVEIMRVQYRQAEVWKNRAMVGKGEAITQEAKWTGAGSTYDEVAPWWRNFGASKDSKSLERAFDNILSLQKDQTKVPSQIKLTAMFELMDPDNGNPVFMLAMGDERGAANILHKYLDEGVPIDQFIENPVYGERLLDLLNTPVDELPSSVEDFIDLRRLLGKEVPEVTVNEVPFSDSKLFAENLSGIEEMLTKLETGIKNNWGSSRPGYVDRDVEKAVWAYAKQVKNRVDEAQLVARPVANEARKFALHAYSEKTYFDLAAAYIFPYHFWYTRTYANWLKRLAYNPEVVAAYAKYKDALAKIHAGSPEWYKYNINTNELGLTKPLSFLGIDEDNPLFFNLEATLNPVNGLTGVDFTDPGRRVTWYGRMLDDLNKFGPTVWSPIQWGVALAMKMQGEDDAAARWAGRLLPQTAPLKAGVTLLQDKFGLEPFRIGNWGLNELDPWVNLFSNGIDPYERSRVGNAMGELMDMGYDPSTLYDQAYRQEGDLWDMATELAIRKRAGGQLSSFMLGVGFKARNQFEMQIERYYQEMRFLASRRPDMSEEQYRQGWRDLKEKYPWGDMILMSKRAGDERDEAYAYSVLGRMPPGRADDMMEAADVSRDLLNQFYADKGDMTKWAETDRDRFMAGVVSLGSVLELPDDATRDEWDMAREGYRQMEKQLAQQYGDDIQDRIDLFWVKKQDGNEVAYAYLDDNPEVKEAMSRREQILLGDPVLSQYYASVDMLERYYRSTMYEAIRRELGEDIWDKYFASFDPQERRDMYANDPKYARYSDLKSMYEKIIADELIKIGGNLPEPQFPGMRAGTPDSVRKDIINAMQPEPTMLDLGWEDFKQEMNGPLQRIVIDNVMLDLPMPYLADDAVERVAEYFDISVELMMELIRRDLDR